MAPLARDCLPGLFVTGTDTGVGKTRIAAAIVRALTHTGRSVGVLKPVATGAVTAGETWRAEDAEALLAARGGGADLRRVSPLLFEAPLAPPVAARLAGVPLTFGTVLAEVEQASTWWADRGVDLLVVEGVGGLLCPLAEGATVADLALALDYPLVIVARRGLGTLNHILLTVEAARLRGLRIAGLVLNAAEPVGDPLADATNPGELARRLDGLAVLASVDHASDPALLLGPIIGVDWMGWARAPRIRGG